MQLKDKQSHLDIMDKMLSNPETMTNEDLDVLVNGDVSNFEDGVQLCSERTDTNDKNLSNLEMAANDNLDVFSDDGNVEERSVSEPSSIVEVDSPIRQVGRKRRVLQYSSSEENCESPVKQLNASSSANISQRVLSIKLKKCDDYFKDIMPPATQQSQQQQSVDVVCKSSPATPSHRLEVVCTLVSDSDVECEFVSISQQHSAFHHIVDETDSQERECRLTTSHLAVQGSDVDSSLSFENNDDGDEVPAQLVHLKRINKVILYECGHDITTFQNTVHKMTAL